MSEFSCLHGNERYAACDDESYTVTSRDFVCQSPNQNPLPKVDLLFEGLPPPIPRKNE